METIEIVEEKIKKDKNGKEFANVRLADGRYTNIMFGDYDNYEGLGTYFAELTRDGRFWRLSDLDKNTKGSVKAPEAPKQEASKHTLRPQYSQTAVDRAKLLNSCIMSACEVFHGTGTEIEATNKFLNAQINNLASSLLSWAEKNSQNTLEEVPF